MQQARERAERRAGNAARNLGSAGLPRIVAGGLKRRAQESAGRSGTLHAARLGDARARLDEAERAVRDDDQIVPYADAALLSIKLLKHGTLKIYEGYPHGMCTTHPEVINPDLLAFIES